MGIPLLWMFPKIGGGPPKWMVKIMVPNPIKMDDLEVFPIFLVQHPKKWRGIPNPNRAVKFVTMKIATKFIQIHGDLG